MMKMIAIPLTEDEADFLLRLLVAAAKDAAGPAKVPEILPIISEIGERVASALAVLRKEVVPRKK